jgi:hypothetical protein
MWKTLLVVLFACVSLLSPALAAPDVPPSLEDAVPVPSADGPAPEEWTLGTAVDLLEAATRDGKAAGVAAGLLMALIWLARRLPRVAALPPKWLPVLSLVTASFPGLVVVLLRPEVSVAQVLEATVGIWAVANGLWSGGVETVARFQAPKAP